MTRYEIAQGNLRAHPHRWLVTGAAGFIGSNITRTLLSLGQHVVGMDNFSSGYQRNIDQALQEAQSATDGDTRGTFRLVRGDIEDLAACRDACHGVDYVIHLAAIASVPRSMEDPIGVTRCNVDGFVNMLVAARDAGVRRLVYASSCALYGDAPGSPKREHDKLLPLSPYAVSKRVNELYANVFGRAYGFSTIGLRYFNVFGPRQDPDGPYAAVIPCWTRSLLMGQPCRIYGDGLTTRDFVFVDDVVQANLLAALADRDADGTAYNIGSGEPTSLVRLFGMVRDAIAVCRPELEYVEPVFEEFRDGDIRHSRADIAFASTRLGFSPAYSVSEGLRASAEWYAANLVSDQAVPQEA